MYKDDTIDTIACMPLMCVRLRPTSVIKWTPYVDLLLFIKAAVFQFGVFKHMLVDCGHRDPRFALCSARHTADAWYTHGCSEHVDLQKTNQKQVCDFFQIVWLDQHVSLILNRLCVMLTIGNEILLSYRLSSKQTELKPHHLVTKDRVMITAFVLLALFSMRLIFTCTVTFNNQVPLCNRGAVPERRVLWDCQRKAA